MNVVSALIDKDVYHAKTCGKFTTLNS